MQIKSNTTEEYIKQVPADRRETIIRLRKLILENLPEGFTEEYSNLTKPHPDMGKGCIRFKKVILFLFISFLFTGIKAQSSQVYDSTFEKSMEADEYGMKSYILVILKTGTNNLEKGSVRDSIFRGHMNNIVNLAGSGKLVISGPLGDNERSYRGIFILNVKTISEAMKLLETDPAVHSKVLSAELYKWYGPAALSEYLKVQKNITRKEF